MISKLPNLAQLTFDGLNIHASELERFWGEISASASLTTLICTNMNLERWEGGVDLPNLKSILFQWCTNIQNDIGYILHEDQISITKLQFDECSFVNTNSMKGPMSARRKRQPRWFTDPCLVANLSVIEREQPSQAVRTPFDHSVCHSAIPPAVLTFPPLFCCGLRRRYTTVWLHSLHACIWDFFVSTTHIMTNS